jgi:predicted nucleotidyltransferase
MAQEKADVMIISHVRQYIKILQDNGLTIWRLYLFGSHARGAAYEGSDIDLAVFLDRDAIDGFDEDIQLMRLTRDVDLSIETHSFSRKDFENPDPFVQEIIATRKRIL